MPRPLLVAVDFSPVTAAVLAAAADEARARGAEVHLVHVAAPEPAFVGREVDPPEMRNVVAHELREEHRRLQALAAELERGGLVVTALCVQGPTVEKIVSIAERIGADRVIVGSHGRGPLARALLGSVSEALLRAAPCPVLVVPHPRAGV